MKTELLHWEQDKESFSSPSISNGDKTNLVIYFGDRHNLAKFQPYSDLRKKFPKAQIVGCSTGGEISQKETGQSLIVATSIEFASTQIRVAEVSIDAPDQSLQAGMVLGAELKDHDLAGVMLFSDGIVVNGSQLAKGINSILGEEITVVGGLAGDGDRFEKTLVGINDTLSPNRIAAIGFYGSDISFGHGSDSGFGSFGPKRKITRSDGNILYELDGKPALDLYKRYLGSEAASLPGSALHFPLQVWDPADPSNSVVRTILAVDEDNNSMIFAGDVPEGNMAQLMRGTLDRLVEGASNAARSACNQNEHGELALLVSCIGRRLVMGQRFEDEIDAVQQEFGGELPFIGFYSYGEICPGDNSGPALLHNETMTITVLSERSA